MHHTGSVKSLEKQLTTSLTKGLTKKNRQTRLKKFGENTLPTTPPPTLLAQIIDQLKNPIVILLLGSATVAAFTGKAFDSGLIFSIVIFMAGIGAFLERQSEKSLEKLKSLQATTTTILLNGVPKTVESASLVPGDIIVLQDGETISADARIIKSKDLKVDEASLTGESLPISKQSGALAEKTALAERKNMLFAGTAIVEGSVHALVVATGANTEIGKIATLINEAEQAPTPLQQELDKIGNFILISTLVSAAVILAVFLLRQQPLIDSLILTSALAIAFVPEGLSAVLTVTLALAVTEMVAKKVIVKRLLAAEGLGSVTHIATDKTGTITEGQMKVAKIYLNNTLFEVTDASLKKQPGYKRYIDIIKFCNNNKGPTEQALVAFLERQGFAFELEGRKLEYRFTSDLKRMSVIHDTGETLKLMSKGAPDILIPLCTTRINDASFSKAEKNTALQVAEELASQGFRVLALADKTHTGEISANKREAAETELCFVGLVAFMDPLRESVHDTVTGLHNAGVVPLMITGDHPAIARYIAQQAGIITSKNDRVLTGNDLDRLFAKSVLPESTDTLLQTRVFARVKPEHKVMLIDLYQQNGYRIAMTGDGVNDAAAIKRADVGIAMSNGVGLTKDIADVVITGSYDALLRAVAIGRTVKLRTQLYLHYLLSGNSCQVSLFFIATALNTPIPLTSIMLLLINLFTDALPAMAMAVEPEDPSVMKGRGNAQDGILSRMLLTGIVLQAILTTIILSGTFLFFLPYGVDAARTATFTLYLFQKAFRGITARSFTRSVFQYGFFTNKLMNFAVPSVLIAWMVLYFVIPQSIGLVALPNHLLLGLVGLGMLPPLLEELTKWHRRRS